MFPRDPAPSLLPQGADCRPEERRLTSGDNRHWHHSRWRWVAIVLRSSKSLNKNDTQRSLYIQYLVEWDWHCFRTVLTGAPWFQSIWRESSDLIQNTLTQHSAKLLVYTARGAEGWKWEWCKLGFAALAIRGIAADRAEPGLSIKIFFINLKHSSVGSLETGWWRWPLLCCGVKIWKLDNLKCSTSATAPSPGLAWSRLRSPEWSNEDNGFLASLSPCPAPPIIMHYSEPSSGENYFLHNKYSCRLFRFVMGEEENRMRGIIGFFLLPWFWTQLLAYEDILSRWKMQTRVVYN